MAALDLTGQRFGKLTAIHRVENKPRRTTRWLCKCDCGNEVIVTTQHLVTENTKSCGCLTAPVYVEVDGEKLTFSQCAEKYGVSVKTIQTRYYRGRKGLELVSHTRLKRRNKHG